MTGAMPLEYKQAKIKYDAAFYLPKKIKDPKRAGVFNGTWISQ